MKRKRKIERVVDSYNCQNVAFNSPFIAQLEERRIVIPQNHLIQAAVLCIEILMEPGAEDEGRIDGNCTLDIWKLSKILRRGR